mgnify:FL=1
MIEIVKKDYICKIYYINVLLTIVLNYGGRLKMESKYVKVSKEKQMQEIRIIDSKISLNEKKYTIGITIILAIIYDVFFTSKQKGISIPIFYIMFMCFFLWSIRKKVLFEKNIGLNIIVPTLLLTLNYSIHSNNILNYFNTIMILLLTKIGRAHV